MVDKYMEYLSTTKTLEQNLYEYAYELKKKLDNLHDAEWSMNNLYLVLILAHSMKSTDVDERGTQFYHFSCYELGFENTRPFSKQQTRYTHKLKTRIYVIIQTYISFYSKEQQQQKQQ